MSAGRPRKPSPRISVGVVARRYDRDRHRGEQADDEDDHPDFPERGHASGRLAAAGRRGLGLAHGEGGRRRLAAAGRPRQVDEHLLHRGRRRRRPVRRRHQGDDEGGAGRRPRSSAGSRGSSSATATPTTAAPPRRWASRSTAIPDEVADAESDAAIDSYMEISDAAARCAPASPTRC